METRLFTVYTHLLHGEADGPHSLHLGRMAKCLERAMHECWCLALARYLGQTDNVHEVPRARSSKNFFRMNVEHDVEKVLVHVPQVIQVLIHKPHQDSLKAEVTHPRQVHQHHTGVET